MAVKYIRERKEGNQIQGRRPQKIYTRVGRSEGQQLRVREKEKGLIQGKK